jgi:hypothetical protein
MRAPQTGLRTPARSGVVACPAAAPPTSIPHHFAREPLTQLAQITFVERPFFETAIDGC